MSDAAEAARLRDELHHYDPIQLWFQLQEIVIERGYLRHGVDVGEGDVVLDVGANVGVAAADFASVRRAGTVHSFEPVPQVYELLEQNVAHYEACTAHPYGLGAEAAMVSFTYYPLTAAMSGRYADPEADRAIAHQAMIRRGIPPEDVDAELAGRFAATPVTVELRRLSDVIAELGLERIDLLKIDVEKAERDVLAGLDDDDWPRIAQIASEVHDLNGRLSALAGEIEDRGFRVTVEQAPAFAGTPITALFATR